jgi:hypothetical protein
MHETNDELCFFARSSQVLVNAPTLRHSVGFFVLSSGSVSPVSFSEESLHPPTALNAQVSATSVLRSILMLAHTYGPFVPTFLSRTQESMSSDASVETVGGAGRRFSEASHVWVISNELWLCLGRFHDGVGRAQDGQVRPHATSFPPGHTTGVPAAQSENVQPAPASPAGQSWRQPAPDSHST